MAEEDVGKAPDAQPPPARPSPACAQCGKPRVEKYRPFCSKRCADIDLHRWLAGAYAIPVNEKDPEDAE